MKYVVEYKASVFVHVDTESPDPWKITRVIVNDEALSDPVHIESDNGDQVFYSKGAYDFESMPPQSREDADSASRVLDILEGEEWPSWEIGS